jgi:anti-sigma factor RsiW
VISPLAGWSSHLGGHLGDRASALLDGQLTPEETERAWAHVQECHACRDRVEREGWLKRRLAGLTYDPTACAVPENLKGTLLGAPDDVFFPIGLQHHHDDHARSYRRNLGLAALGGSAVGAAVMGVLAFGAAPASAPTPPGPAAVGSAVPAPIAAITLRPAP